MASKSFDVTAFGVKAGAGTGSFGVCSMACFFVGFSVGGGDSVLDFLRFLFSNVNRG